MNKKKFKSFLESAMVFQGISEMPLAKLSAVEAVSHIACCAEPSPGQLVPSCFLTCQRHRHRNDDFSLLSSRGVSGFTDMVNTCRPGRVEILSGRQLFTTAALWNGNPLSAVLSAPQGVSAATQLPGS